MTHREALDPPTTVFRLDPPMSAAREQWEAARIVTEGWLITVQDEHGTTAYAVEVNDHPTLGSFARVDFDFENSLTCGGDGRKSHEAVSNLARCLLRRRRSKALVLVMVQQCPVPWPTRARP